MIRALTSLPEKLFGNTNYLLQVRYTATYSVNGKQYVVIACGGGKIEASQ